MKPTKTIRRRTKYIKIRDFAGEFAENKDCAAKLRTSEVIPTLENGGSIELDFEGVIGATQSFIHALIADPIRKLGSPIIDKILFKNCSGSVRGIIEIVIDYVQVNIDEDMSLERSR